ALPGAVVLVPLPDVAGERGFGVDLELMHVDLFAKDLFDRLDHARMRAEHAEGLVIEMRGKSRAWCAAFFAPDFQTGCIVNADRLSGEEVDLLLAEQFRQKQPAFTIEMLDLFGCQFHGSSSFGFVCRLAFLSRRPRTSCVSPFARPRKSVSQAASS